MRKLVLMLTLFCCSSYSQLGAGSRVNLHLSLLSVDIWPEYDQPAVLMIYRITLAPDTTLACQPGSTHTSKCADKCSGSGGSSQGPGQYSL